MIMLGAAPQAPVGGDDGAVGGRKGRSSRRETWCPGRSAWEPPLAGACCVCVHVFVCFVCVCLCLC